MGVDLHRLAEERSLAIHREVGARLHAEPQLIEAARQRVARWRREGGAALPYIDAWDALLGGPVDEVVRLISDPGERARELRQVSPFAGAVDPRERWRIWREVRTRMGA